MANACNVGVGVEVVRELPWIKVNNACYVRFQILARVKCAESSPLRHSESAFSPSFLLDKTGCNIITIGLHNIKLNVTYCMIPLHVIILFVMSWLPNLDDNHQIRFASWCATFW